MDDSAQPDEAPHASQDRATAAQLTGRPLCLGSILRVNRRVRRGPQCSIPHLLQDLLGATVALTIRGIESLCKATAKSTKGP